MEGSSGLSSRRGQCPAYTDRTCACSAGTSRLENLVNVDGEDQPAAPLMLPMDTLLDHAQGEAMALVECALTPMGHCVGPLKRRPVQLRPLSSGTVFAS